MCTGRTAEELAAAEAGTRYLLGFYGSTPAYRPVLDVHGWGDLQTELNALSKQGEWEQMGTLIDDEILGTFAVVAEPSMLAAGLKARYADAVTRVMFYAPYQSDPEVWLPIVEELQRD